jgi:hypothetical protein
VGALKCIGAAGAFVDRKNAVRIGFQFEFRSQPAPCGSGCGAPVTGMAPALRGCNSGYQRSVLSVPLGIDVRAMVGRTHAASRQRGLLHG